MLWQQRLQKLSATIPLIFTMTSKKRKTDRIKPSNSYILSQFHGIRGKALAKLYQASFEGNVCLEILKALKYSVSRIRQFPVNDYRCLEFADVNEVLDYRVAIINCKIPLENWIEKSKQIYDLYFSAKEPIVIVNDFNRQKLGGIAMVAVGVSAADVVGSVLIINPPDGERPLLVGKTADIFATLVKAGYISAWDGTYDDSQ